ncbi:MAG: hypothetical protein JEZ03_12440 [Bacteroidales bacterium]|nr:hypothetical protein [Bacteroidales bacterium]
MRILLLLITISIFSFSFQGCNEKQINNMAPEIRISLPNENTNFSVLDSIHIIAEFEDDVMIESVEVQLLTSLGGGVGKKLIINPGSTKYVLNTTYVIDNVLLTSGSYSLKFYATDGEKSTKDLIPLSIDAVDVLVERMIILTEFQESIRVNSLENGMLEEMFTINGDYVDSRIHSFHDQLYVCGLHRLDMKAFDLNSGDTLWSAVESQNQPFHTSDCMSFDGTEVFTSSSDGFIRGYNSAGITVFEVQLNTNNQLGQLHITDDVVVVETIENGTWDHYIQHFYRYSNGELLTYKLDMDVIDMHPIDNKNWFIVANDENAIHILKGNKNEYRAEEIEIIEGEKAISTAEFDDYIAIATENKIFAFIKNEGNIIEVSSGFQIRKIVPNKETGELCVYSDHDLLIMSFPGGNVKDSFTFESNILNILFDYNK